MARELENRSLEELREGLATGRYRPRELEAVREEISRREQQQEAAERRAEQDTRADEALMYARVSDRRSSLAMSIALLALLIAGLALFADPDAREFLEKLLERDGGE